MEDRCPELNQLVALISDKSSFATAASFQMLYSVSDMQCNPTPEPPRPSLC